MKMEYLQRQVLQPVAGTIVDALFPRRCPVCQDVVRKAGDPKRKICPECYERLPFVEEPFCMKCGRRMQNTGEAYCRNCQKHKFSFDYGRILMDYEDLTRDSLASVKYKGKREYLDFYGEEAAKRLGEDIRGMCVQGLVPVPVHWKRRNKRGYNQAEVLSYVIGRELGLPVYASALKRRANTKALKELGAAQRQKNLSHAFYFGTLPEGVESVLLVDDIFTTGATIETCTRALREAGVKHVYSLCLTAKMDHETAMSETPTVF